MTFHPEFQMGDTVFLNVSNSDEHLVTNINYDVASGIIKYHLLDSTGQKGWFSEMEVTTSKRFR